MDLRSRKKAFLAEVLGEEEAAKIWEMAERATKELERHGVSFKEKRPSLAEHYAGILREDAAAAALPYDQQLLWQVEELLKERAQKADEEPWSEHPANPYIDMVRVLQQDHDELYDALSPRRRRN